MSMPTCPVCGQTFPNTNINVLLEHLRTHPTAPCPVCGEQLSTTDDAAMVAHMKQHPDHLSSVMLGQMLDELCETGILRRVT